MSKLLLAGPWLGEFGWELMMWQAHIRKVACDDKYDDVICIVRSGHDFMYSDFTDRFIFMDIDGSKNGWKINEKNPTVPSGILQKFKDDDVRVIEPSAIDFKCQNFIKYEVDSPHKYDLLFHCRSTTKLGTEYRNWPVKRWELLRDNFNGLKIACIGSKDESIVINGTDDLRGCGLKELASYCCNSKIMIGPSSGPMHFASLCGCTHIVFTDTKIRFRDRTNRYRYEEGWNPLGTKAIVIDEEGWRPSVATVVKSIEGELKDAQ